MTDTDLLNFDKYLFVTEIGSRMWGMAEVSSDHDMFCCYQTSSDEYMRTGNFIPTMPAKHHVIINGKEYDFQFMEIGHLINLLSKGNINAIWAVSSGIIHKDSVELQELRELVKNNLSKSSYDSVRGMALSQYYDIIKRKDVKSPEKSLVTCLRTLKFGITMMKYKKLQFDVILSLQDIIIKDIDNTVLKFLNMLQDAYNASELPENPDKKLLQDYLYRIRMKEIHNNKLQGIMDKLTFDLSECDDEHGDGSTKFIIQDVIALYRLFGLSRPVMRTDNGYGGLSTEELWQKYERTDGE